MLVLVVGTIDCLRILQYWISRNPFAVLQFTVETAGTASMTGDAAFLLDLVNQHIAIAIETQLQQALHVTRLFAFAPELAA